MIQKTPSDWLVLRWAKMEENGENVGTEITNLDLAIDEVCMLNTIKCM